MEPGFLDSAFFVLWTVKKFGMEVRILLNFKWVFAYF